MPKFQVEVTHEYTKVQYFEVEADTQEEAEELGMDHEDIDWSDPEHCGYEARAWKTGD